MFWHFTNALSLGEVASVVHHNGHQDHVNERHLFLLLLNSGLWANIRDEDYIIFLLLEF